MLNGHNRLAGRRILIFQQRGWALSIGHFLARNFQAEGADLAAITLKRSTDEFIRTQTEVDYKLIISHDDVMELPTEYLGSSNHTGEHICRELGVPSLWPFAQSLRNHVRTYGEAYYYSYKQNVSDELIFEFFKAAYEMCQRVFERFNPEIIVAPNFVDVPHIFMNLYAKSRNVPMIAITDTKVVNLTCFSHNYLDSEGPFIDRIHELNAGLTSENSNAARKYIRDNRERLSEPDLDFPIYSHLPLRKELRRLLTQIRHHRTMKQVPIFGPTIDAASPYTLIRDLIQHRRYRANTLKRNYYPIEDVGLCALFPLQWQPEASIDVTAPHFNNQIETARQIAMSLPDDMTLLVKDHPEMLGYRSPKYLEKIARLPNVKLVNPATPMMKLLQTVQIVIGTTGTVFAEAAMLRVPSIQLGDLGITLQLPNVLKHTNMTTLAEKIRTSLTRDLTTEVYEKRLENFVGAAFDVGFNVNYLGIWERGEQADHKLLFDCYLDEILRVIG